MIILAGMVMRESEVRRSRARVYWPQLRGTNNFSRNSSRNLQQNVEMPTCVRIFLPQNQFLCVPLCYTPSHCLYTTHLPIQSTSTLCCTMIQENLKGEYRKNLLFFHGSKFANSGFFEASKSSAQLASSNTDRILLTY